MKTLVVLMVAVLVSRCSAIRWASGDPVTKDEVMQDIGDAAAIGCAAVSANDRDKIRPVVAQLKTMVDAGDADGARRLLEAAAVQAAPDDVQALILVTVRRGVKRLGEGESTALVNEGVAAAVGGCADAVL